MINDKYERHAKDLCPIIMKVVQSIILPNPILIISSLSPLILLHLLLPTSSILLPLSSDGEHDREDHMEGDNSSGTDTCYDLAYLANLFVRKALPISYRILCLRRSPHCGDSVPNRGIVGIRYLIAGIRYLITSRCSACCHKEGEGEGSEGDGDGGGDAGDGVSTSATKEQHQPRLSFTADV